MFAYRIRRAVGLFMESVWIDVAIWFLLWALIVAILTGCSATENISRNAGDSQQHATAIRTDVAQAKQSNAAGDKPAVDTKLTDIDGHAAKIQENSEQIQIDTTKVQDRTPYWMGMVKWVAVAVVVVALILLAWRLNLLIFFESGIQWLSTKAHLWLGKLMGA